MSDRETFSEAEDSLRQDCSPIISQSLFASDRTVFHALLDHSPQLFWIVSPDGTLLDANQTALDFGSVELQAMIGQPIYAIAGWAFPEREQPRLRAAIAAAAAESEPATCHEANMLNASGQRTTFELSVRAVSLSSEGSSALMIEGIDISDRKRAESQLLRCQRLESIGAMFTGIIHDLNNFIVPLAVVAEILRIDFPEADAEQQNLFKLVATNTHRARGLIGQILAFARGSEEAQAPLPIRQLIADVQRLIQPTFSNSIIIKTSLPSELWPLEGNDNQLHQVLVNLCLNARDAMPTGGIITISAKNMKACKARQLADSDTLSSRLSDSSIPGSSIPSSGTLLKDYVMLQVSDTGEGIPTEIIDKIFEPFFTTKASRQGSGLGLSTTLTIVQDHGGFIDVLSTVERGSQFRVFLPAIA